jgi:hypothetical protein
MNTITYESKSADTCEWCLLIDQMHAVPHFAPPAPPAPAARAAKKSDYAPMQKLLPMTPHATHEWPDSDENDCKECIYAGVPRLMPAKPLPAIPVKKLPEPLVNPRIKVSIVEFGRAPHMPYLRSIAMNIAYNGRAAEVVNAAEFCYEFVLIRNV